MYHAFTVLHLAPDLFWTMTPREFAAALPQQRHVALSRHRFEELCTAFPDEGARHDCRGCCDIRRCPRAVD